MIWTVHEKDQEKFLRRATARFDFKKWTKPNIKDLIKTMRQQMKRANGIGLSANQIGVEVSVFIAHVDGKFYSIFNPKITRASEEKIILEEGCLSVPEMYGPVERPERIIIESEDASGKKIKIKAWGLLARVFQHEIDHLNGLLFIDHAEEVYKITTEQTTQGKN